MTENQKIVEEFKKCKEDASYFLSNYVKVTHPVRGLVNFDLYPFQERIVSALGDYRFNILRKFRQAGCTTIAASWALWTAIFEKHKTIVIISKGDAESTEVLDRIKLMYDNLPEEFKPGIIEDNKHTLKLKTNSTIKSRPSGKQSGRSLAGSILIIDEAAFIDNIDSIWAAVYPIISTGGKAFVLSTVNGIGNWFFETYYQAKEQKNSFNCLDIHWQEHPEYNRQVGYEHLYEAMLERSPPLDIDHWEAITKSNMPLKQWLQEYECSFLGTGETYFDGEVLTSMKENVVEDYGIKYNNKMRVWKDPEPFYEYILAADVSLGRGRDYSAFHIINMYNGEQVAEFYSNKTPINEFAEIISHEARLYNTAHVICERNTIGNNLIDWLFTILEYDNLWFDERNNIGFQTTSSNREVLLAGLEEALRTEFLKINSERTVEELFTFIVSEGGKAQAEKGKCDDLVISLALAVYGYKTILDTTPMEHMDKAMMRDKKSFNPGIIKGKRDSKRLGISKEDYKWLIS
jgi:hypothetical protein